MSTNFLWMSMKLVDVAACLEWWLDSKLHVYQCLFRVPAMCVMLSAPSHCDRKHDEMFPGLKSPRCQQKQVETCQILRACGEKCCCSCVKKPLFKGRMYCITLSHSCVVAIATQCLCEFTKGRCQRTFTLSASDFPPCHSHSVVFQECFPS